MARELVVPWSRARIYEAVMRFPYNLPAMPGTTWQATRMSLEP